MTVRRHSVHPHDSGVTGSDDALGDEADLIGAASAQLLSTCSDRADRLAALGLLGLLLDHADATGRVRMPLEDVAFELEVENHRVVLLLQRLVAIGAVRADGDAVMVVGEHFRPEGVLRPSRFLANVMTVFEHEPSTGLPFTNRTTTPDQAVASPSRPRRRALAALTVAAAAMVLATAPSGDLATSLRTEAPSTGINGRAAWASPSVVVGATTTTPLPVEGLRPGPNPDGTPSARPSTGNPSARPELATGPTSASNPGVGPQARATPTTVPTSTSPTTNVPLGVPRTPSMLEPPPQPDEGPAPAALPCPVERPEAQVSLTRDLATGPLGLSGLSGERLLEITGTVHNASDEAITLVRVAVGAGLDLQRVVRQATTTPDTIPPGGTGTWTTDLRTVVAGVLGNLIDVEVLSWDWLNPELSNCPT